MIERRQFVAGTAGMMVAGPSQARGRPLFGLIGKMIAKHGQRDALVTFVLEGVATMPGCISYIVATDAGDENAIWVTEVWEDAASHAASLKLPAVAGSISRALPLIDLEAKGLQVRIVPVGGTGIG